MHEPPRPDQPFTGGEFAFDPAPVGRPPNRVEVGELLLTVEPPGRSDVTRSGIPPAAHVRRTTGRHAPGAVPLIGRDLEAAELAALLEGHVHVRVRGPAGVGRTALLHHLAARVALRAPDGVVHLDGRGHGLDDLLQQLHDACLTGPPRRWDRRAAVRGAALRDLAALVVVDDLDLHADDVRRLLAVAPESVFLVAGPGESAEALRHRALGEGDRSPHAAPFHDFVLPGLARDAAVALVERAAARQLTDDERAWARALAERVDGHPAKLLQIAALLRGTRRRGGRPSPGDTGFDLPALVEPQLLAGRLVAQLGDRARAIVRVGAVLGGPLPGPEHLPGVIGADAPDSAAGVLAELDALIGCGLVVREHGRYRLAAGVAEALAPALRGQASWAVSVLQRHTAWLATAPEPAEVAREAPALLAALAEAGLLGQTTPVRTLARTVAPVLATALRWEAWEGALRVGLEAAEAAGATADEAWFRHELAVHALCTGDRPAARDHALAAARLHEAAGEGAAREADLRLADLAAEPAASLGPKAAAGAGQGRRVMLAGAAALVAVFAVTMAVVTIGGGDDTDRPVVPVAETRAPVAENPPDADVSAGPVVATTDVPAAGPVASASPAASTPAADVRPTTARPTATRPTAPATSTRPAPAPTTPKPGGTSPTASATSTGSGGGTPPTTTPP